MQDFLEKYFSANEPIIIGCSTGPDSMYLLYKILETKFAKNVVACYFNHGLREESLEEEKFLEKLGKQKGFKVEIANANMKEIHKNFYNSISLEELCRQKRYEFFDAILHIYGAKKILLAHHLDDKIETFFFNLARGSKLTGLINMQEDSGAILRPLLGITKAEILEYLEENGLEYKIDKTNFENDFTRNKIRNIILPNFSEINKNYKKNISNFMNYLAEIKDFVDFEVKRFLRENSTEKYFLISEFNELSDFLKKEVLRYIFYISNGNSTIGLSEANIQEVIKFINGKNSKTKKEIKSMSLRKEQGKIWY
ncbi:tRNA lysidine(34) synthetase TilS [Candidatus Gracilibacteria bacterium]|nr:tRNA lysidine(34) synthetase TilS [Candidatus Gracilibacteria bacterium]